MKIIEFLENRSASGATPITESEANAIRTYVQQFNYAEVLQFCDSISHLLFALHDAAKVQDLTKENDLGIHVISTTLIFIQVIETIQENREMLREIIKAREFDITTPS